MMSDTAADRTKDPPPDPTTDHETDRATDHEPDRATGQESDGATDRKTRVTVLVALAANLVIAAAKAVGGLVAGSPALLSEAAHSVADSLNEVFLLAALRRSRRPADRQHPFGYGKERFFWSLLAAVGIFVMGGCFSVFQGIEALRNGAEETSGGYVAGLVVLAVEGISLLRALHQVRGQGGGMDALRDPALRTVVAGDGTGKPRRDGGARRGLNDGCPTGTGSCAPEQETFPGPESASGTQLPSAGSRTNTGICRSVFSWYSAYGGYAATARSHHSAFSSPVISRAVSSHFCGPS